MYTHIRTYTYTYIHTNTYIYIHTHKHTYRYYIWHQPASATSMYITINALPSIDKDNSDSAIDTREYMLYAAQGRRPSHQDNDAELIFTQASSDKLAVRGQEQVLRVEPTPGGCVFMYVCIYMCVCTCMCVCV